MQPKHYLFLFVGPYLQAILVLAAASNLLAPSFQILWTCLALTLPIPFYYWSFRDAPLGLTRMPPGLRVTILILGGALLSGLGFFYGLMLLTSRSLQPMGSS